MRQYDPNIPFSDEIVRANAVIALIEGMSLYAIGEGYTKEMMEECLAKIYTYTHVGGWPHGCHEVHGDWVRELDDALAMLAEEHKAEACFTAFRKGSK